MPESNLHKLSALGQSVWIDYLSRQMLQSGKLATDDGGGCRRRRYLEPDDLPEGDLGRRCVRQAAEGDPRVGRRWTRRRSSSSSRPTTFRTACDLLRKVWDEGGGLDGYVSWEVDPTLAYDRDGTIAEAHRLHDWIDKPNLYVKIPATEPGLGAIEEMIAAGKNINVTLIFSLERHKEVMEAYVRGLERLVESGGDPERCTRSRASSSRAWTRKRTSGSTRSAATPPKLKGKLAIANAKLAYQNYLEVFAGPRWAALEAKGATKQRCLWASTSTKNPDYRDVMYIEELIGPETVNTMPEETILAFQDHGKVELTLAKDVEAARKLFEDLAAAGVDYDDVSNTLEREGVQKFTDSFQELLDGISAKRGELAPA